MFTLLIAVLLLVAIVGAIGIMGFGSAAMEFGKVVFCCAIVLVLISAVIGVVRGRARA